MNREQRKLVWRRGVGGTDCTFRKIKQFPGPKGRHQQRCWITGIMVNHYSAKTTWSLLSCVSQCTFCSAHFFSFHDTREMLSCITPLLLIHWEHVRTKKWTSHGLNPKDSSSGIYSINIKWFPSVLTVQMSSYFMWGKDGFFFLLFLIDDDVTP